MRSKDKFPDEISLERLTEVVNQLNIAAWGQAASEEDLLLWLDNFDGKFLGNEIYERKLATWILIHFTYYNVDEVRSLCKSLFAEFLHRKLVEYQSIPAMKKLSINDQIETIQKSTVFVPIGNPSESGATISYFFRQANGLSKESFGVDNSEGKENLVYLDDVSLTGSQAVRYFREMSPQSIKKRYFAPLFTTKESIIQINREYPDIVTIPTTVLDSRAKCFSEESFVFSGEWCKSVFADAKTLCEEYGKLITKNHPYMGKYPLGYGDSQILIGFFL